MKDIDIFVDKITDDFLSRVNSVKDRFDYFNKYDNNSSPLTNLYDWKTDDYSLVNLFRGSDGNENSEFCFDINSLSDVISAVKFALNNNQGFDDYMSFSETLHIALFKYGGKYLELTTSHKNCIGLHLVINCFNWLDVKERYFDVDIYVDIPLKYIFNKEVIEYLVYNSISDRLRYFKDVYEDMYDVDTIKFIGISNFNISLKDVNKDDLHKAVNETQSYGGLKSVISYKTDSEVIFLDNIEYLDIFRTSSQAVTDDIRFYYLLRLYNFEFLASDYLLRIDRAGLFDDVILKNIVSYMNTYKNFERDSYKNTYWDYANKAIFSPEFFNGLIDRLYSNNYVLKSSYEKFKDFLIGKPLV